MSAELQILNLVIAVAFGILGGFVHDIVQNKRKWQKTVTTSEGTYLGSAAGLLLGGISGLLVGLAADPNGPWQTAAYTGLSAGIALKGLAEGAGTKQPPAA